MRNIGTDDHAVFIQHRGGIELVVRAIQFRIDFQQYVGDGTLIGALFDQCSSFDTLSEHTATQFGRLFNAGIRVPSVGYNAE